jgi:hypothetical protein
LTRTGIPGSEKIRLDGDPGEGGGCGGRPRQNNLVITAFGDYDHILEKYGGARSFFAQDKAAS